MLQKLTQTTAVLSLLTLGAAGVAGAQETVGAPSNSWQTPNCARIVGTSGVTYTLDEGATLAPTAQALTGTSYTAGLAALDTPNTLLAAVGSTILRSTDGGCVWRTVADLTQQSGGELLSLAKSRGDRAYIWSDNRGLLFRIDGATVTALRTPASAIVGIAADRTNGDRVRIGDGAGQVWESSDAGASWRPVGAPAIQDTNLWAYRVAFDPANLDHVVVGAVLSGSWASFDGGVTWQQSKGLAAKKANVNVFNVVVSPADPNVVWSMGIDLSVSDTDPGRGRFIFRSVDGGVTFTRALHEEGNVTLVNGPTMAAHPANPEVLYFVFGSSFGNYGTDLYRLDASTGQVTVNHNAYHGIKAIEFSPASPSAMYLGVAHEQVR